MTRSSMPTPSRIVKHWSGRLINVHRKMDDISDCETCCFACGFQFEHVLQRCHILPVNLGGDNSPENLHMLCHMCHIQSEELFGRAYWDWFSQQTLVKAYECVGQHRERRAANLSKSIKRGVSAAMATRTKPWGRPPKTPYDPADILALHQQGLSQLAIATRLGISRATVKKVMLASSPIDGPPKSR